MSILDTIASYVPHIKKPEKPLSFNDKLKWTAIVMIVYFAMFSTPAFGVSTSSISQTQLQVLNIIFAARVGTLITVGIGPIVLASIVLQLLQGAGVINMDLSTPESKGRYQSIQKLAAIGIALVESVIFTLYGYVPVSLSSTISIGTLNIPIASIVILQLAISAIIVIFLDEIMVKFGITSGINLFIAGGVSYSVIASTVEIILPSAAAAIAAGGASALSNAALAFGPLIFAVVVMLISIYAYDMKVELPLAFSQFRGVGGRLPIPFLYVSVLPVILATSLIVSLTVWFSFLSGVNAGAFVNFAHFLATYTVQTAQVNGKTVSSTAINGGIFYLMSPNFPAPYPEPYGIGYSAYFQQLLTGTSNLYMPWGGFVLVPEWAHVIVYSLTLIILCIIFGRFWIEMTGQSPKNVASQLQDVGWQIPGFRRDPRVIESVLDKYIPTITILGSITVACLAIVATLTGAVGSGMGILLTVGIMYMIYQQLERDNMLEGYGKLNEFLSS
jgi:preprotein translocase subunit SecY